MMSNPCPFARNSLSHQYAAIRVNTSPAPPSPLQRISSNPCAICDPARFLERRFACQLSIDLFADNHRISLHPEAGVEGTSREPGTGEGRRPGEKGQKQVRGARTGRGGGRGGGWGRENAGRNYEYEYGTRL